MLVLILGLILFVVVHSLRVWADAWRSAQIERWGIWPWRVAYSVVSVIAIAMVIWGYGQARMTSIDLWSPPAWTRLATVALTLPAFGLWAASLVPGTRVKAALGYPVAAGVKVWALAHLLSNGRLADVLLFGSFLLWAVLIFSAGRRRAAVHEVMAAGLEKPRGSMGRDLLAVALGVLMWFGFARGLHAPLIGVAPLG